MTAEQAEGPTDEVLFDRRRHLGVITLNRPKAVNALTGGMVAAISERLAAWENDDSVAAVLVQGAGERGLCAGGAIVAIYPDILAGGGKTVLSGNRFIEQLPYSSLKAQRDWIDSWYAGNDIEEIFRRLRGAGGEAANAVDSIESKSPTSVKVTLASLRRARA